MTAAATLVDAEHATVGALLLAAPELQRAALDVLRGDDFEDLRCRFAVDTIRRMLAENAPVDQVTVAGYAERHGLLADGRLRGSLALWLADCASQAPTPAAVRWYAQQVAEAGCRRAIRAAAEQLVVIAQDAGVKELWERIGETTAAITRHLDRLREVTAR